MNPAVQAFGDLVVDGAAEADETTESRLHVAAGAAEPVVEIEMTESGIQIIAPHQSNHTPAEPDAFWIACGAIDGLRGFDKLGSLALAVPRRSGCSFRCVWLLLLLF